MPDRVIRYAHWFTARRVIDGDSVVGDVDVDVDLVRVDDHVRVLDVDTPEIRDTLGPAARDYTAAWIRDHPDLIVRTWKRDSFGRRLAYIIDRHTGESLSVAIATVTTIVRAHLEELSP